MKIEINKKIFDVGEGRHKVHLSLPTPMHEALNYIAEQENESIPKIVTQILESYLVMAAEAKQIPLPGKTTSNTKKAF